MANGFLGRFQHFQVKFIQNWLLEPNILVPGFSPVVIADFELMKEAFSKKELCSRLSRVNQSNDLMRQLESGSRKFYNVPKAALEILGPGLWRYNLYITVTTSNNGPFYFAR